jgi:hypothetical protein
MWNVSNEGFIANSGLNDIFSDMRLKLSYGRVGNMFGIDNYSSLFLYSSSLYGGVPTLYFSQAGNSDLKWETSDKYDVGLSFGLLNDRLQADLNYFYNDVNNLILNVPQAPSKGIPGNSIPANVGSMYNTGFEFSLTSFNITSPISTGPPTSTSLHLRMKLPNWLPGLLRSGQLLQTLKPPTSPLSVCPLVTCLQLKPAVLIPQPEENICEFSR